MTRRNGQNLLVLLAAAIGLSLLSTGSSWAGACDDPTDPNPNPRQIPKCVVLKLGPYGFDKFQHTHWNASCPSPNTLFLGNDDGYLGDPGYEVDNNCFSVWEDTPQFDNQFEAFVINWCDKPETVNLSLGCLPGN
jgi:hypothetical protein